MKKQTVLILDFGGQYKELIARRVRELSVYSVVKPGDMPLDEIQAMNPIGIILTGGPNSVNDPKAPRCDPRVFSLGIPTLGICYGMHLLGTVLGGTVAACEKREYGCVKVTLEANSPLFAGLDCEQSVLMSHSDHISALPSGFQSIARSEICKFPAMACEEQAIYAVQFHPEAENTENGLKIMRNFLYQICGAKGDYSVEDYLQAQIQMIREQVGSKRVLLALSGGVDSSVCAAMLSMAIPGQLVCIFVDHGLMRKNEGDEIEAVFTAKDLQFIRVNAQDRFLARLKGIEEPEEKRKRIGEEFIRVFEEEAKKLDCIAFLAQGTIYPDIIESGIGAAATIKSHHNVGGLPEKIAFEGIVEPLRGLFKDEVRKLGALLALPESIVNRQPFPGPGLAIRVIGEVTKEKLDILREADAIWREEVAASGERADQFFVVLTNLRTVGVMGDERTYQYTAALRAVYTNDFMTCEYAKLPHSLLGRVSGRITGEVIGINRVVYDVTNKPPATIEWE